MKLENVEIAEKLNYEYNYLCGKLKKYNEMLEKDSGRNYVEINGEWAHFENKYIKLIIKKEISILEKMIKEIKDRIEALD